MCLSSSYPKNQLQIFIYFFSSKPHQQPQHGQMVSMATSSPLHTSNSINSGSLAGLQHASPPSPMPTPSPPVGTHPPPPLDRLEPVHING